MLTVAGADPSAASGVYRDVATFGALGCTGLAAVTSVTAQNTSRFAASEQVSPAMVSRQIGAAFDDCRISAVKVGMVYDGDTMAAVRGALLRGIGRQSRRMRGGGGGARVGAGEEEGRVPVVVDPVVRSTTGGRLLDPASIGDYRKKIVPLATVVTPNVQELGVLAGGAGAVGGEGGSAAAGKQGAGGEKGTDTDRMARAVMGMGARSVVVTGVSDGRTVRDMVYDGAASAPYAASRGRPAIGGRLRGSGCTHSAALAALLASGAGLAEAARGAASAAYRSVRNAAPRRGAGAGGGRGLPVAAPASAPPAAARAAAGPAAGAGPRRRAGGAGGAGGALLGAAAEAFAAIDGIGRHIPECQTNIAYAPRRAASPASVLGLDGRIVSTMSGGAIFAGRVALGASRHAAAAVVEASKKFPSVRAAVNIRYDPRTVDAAESLGMSAAAYDRSGEPAAVKRAEGSSVSWGVRSALRGTRRPPDIVYHRGDFGKEPMIMVLGTDPVDAVSKAGRIAAAAAAAAAAADGRGRRSKGRGRGAGRIQIK